MEDASPPPGEVIFASILSDDRLQNVWVGPKEMGDLAQFLIFKQSGDASYQHSNTAEAFHFLLLVVLLSLSAPTPVLLAPPPKASHGLDVVRL